jgi:hypothetical protein
VLRFQEPTFARSFEILNGDFYFGLGCDISPLPAETGSILRIRNVSLSVPTAASNPQSAPAMRDRPTGS